MEIIDELEPVRRGVYGGSILYADFAGNLDSCIAIRTMVMNKGKIIEMGNHKELIAKGGFYADLYNSQFTGQNLDTDAI